MTSFDAAHAALHYPSDRRFRIWIRPSLVIGIVVVIASLVVAAWIEVAVAGLPHVPPVPQIYPTQQLALLQQHRALAATPVVLGLLSLGVWSGTVPCCITAIQLDSRRRLILGQTCARVSHLLFFLAVAAAMFFCVRVLQVGPLESHPRCGLAVCDRCGHDPRARDDHRRARNRAPMQARFQSLRVQSFVYS